MNLRTVVLIVALGLSLGFGEVSAGSNAGAKLYKSECGSCHVAYPSVLLPGKSWDAVLGSLDKHFGDNAELAADDLKLLKGYLDNHNYDQSRIKKRYKNRFDTPGNPIRVTKTRFFRAIHDEVSDRWVSKNPKVKTFARCEACHRGAQNGSFDEDDVHIPR